MKKLIQLVLFALISCATRLPSEARPAAPQCYVRLSCSGRVQNHSATGNTSVDQELIVNYVAIDSQAMPPLAEFQGKNSARLETIESDCNHERYRRSTFGANAWDEDNKFTWMGFDLKCYPVEITESTCRSAGDGCSSNGDCCAGNTCEPSTQACKQNIRVSIPIKFPIRFPKKP